MLEKEKSGDTAISIAGNQGETPTDINGQCVDECHQSVNDISPAQLPPKDITANLSLLEKMRRHSKNMLQGADCQE